MISKPKILVTGSAGFIGFHLCKRLIEDGYDVVGLDNFNNYYSVKLKHMRSEMLEALDYNFKIHQIDLADKSSIIKLFEENRFDYVYNLAAQAGVRYSIKNPNEYIRSNVEGFLNILEACRFYPVKHLIYASSSSVYGSNTEMPFSCQQRTDSPISVYGATKKSNEVMAHSYNHLFNVHSTGLRFFTVYGPWGRPDMAAFLFLNAMFKDEEIKVFNHGNMVRDFTYIDDVVETLVRLMNKPTADGHKIYNVGNNDPVKLMDFIKLIELYSAKKSKMKMMEMQPGDVPKTYAYVEDLYNDIGYKPETKISDGLKKLVLWYLKYKEVIMEWGKNG